MVMEFPSMDLLHVSFVVAGYAPADIAAFRFNNDASARYWDRYVYFPAGSSSAVTVENPNSTLIRVAATAVDDPRSGWGHIMNFRTTSKVFTIANQTGTVDASLVGPTQCVGGGEWMDLDEQINSIQMLTAGGGNLLAGSGFNVFGCNLS
jgi:hypothetical protein